MMPTKRIQSDGTYSESKLMWSKFRTLSYFVTVPESVVQRQFGENNNILLRGGWAKHLKMF